MVKELQHKELRRRISISDTQWNTIRETHPKKLLIGQDRALKAFEFGIGNKGRGFNIYVSGYPGSGKRQAIKHFLEEKAKTENSPGDWCYVNNFVDPYCPKRLQLPKGGALIFKNEIGKLIEESELALVKAFESKEYANKRQGIIEEYQQKENKLYKDIYQKANTNNFAISRTPIEIIVMPIDKAGDPISDQEFRSFSKKEQQRILQKRDNLMKELNSLFRKNRELDKSRREALMQLEKDVALYAIDSLIQELREKYETNQGVLEHLEAVKKDILENLSEFLKASGGKNRPNSGTAPKFLEYEINIITNNADLNGAPIVMELNPTYNNLFGKVEHESHMGTMVTDFTLIRGGALHRANGGYLILPLNELLMSYFSWDGLKRALKNNEVVIEDVGERFGFISAKSLKPDPIPLDVQIVLIGSPWMYFLLYEWDEDFKELFKVKAEFDSSMEFSLPHLEDFSGVVHKIEMENKLMPLDHQAISIIAEHACRMAEDQNRISIRFGDLINVLYEADHYARKDLEEMIRASHVEKAIEARHYRSNLFQEKVNEMILRDQLMIDVEGSRIGQINGISVIDLGDIVFGRPNKITVNIASGKEGLIDIEREAKLGGKLHTKGVLILSGYLGEKYGQNKVISLFASLVFEQSYSEIEGDSASSAELYAILSGLSQLPIRQWVAVSGSVNQKGEVQPVGAINEKVEGFFEICRLRGLSGEQGVIIPRGNLENLMLKPELVEAVREGKFHIWAVQTIDEGIEILMGRPAGSRLKSGSFSKDSVHDLVDKRISSLNRVLALNAARSNN